MEHANFSPRVKDVITFSREESMRLGHDYIGTEHLLLGMIREGDGLAIKILNRLGINLNDLRKAIEQYVKPSNKHIKSMGNIPLIKQAEKALKFTALEAGVFKSEQIGTEHLLLAILKVEDNLAANILNKFGVTYENVKQQVTFLATGNTEHDIRSDMAASSADDESDEDSGTFGGGSKAGGS